MAFIKKIILVIASLGALLAQNQAPEFEQLTASEKILNNTVECIFQDSQGFMWFGTWQGLTRYDGTDFRFYKIFPAHPRFVSSNDVTVLAEDKDGFIWIGSMQGLIRLEPFSGNIHTYRHKAGNPNTPSHDFITSLFVDDDQTIWFGTQGGGLNKLCLNPAGKAAQFPHYNVGFKSNAKSGWNSVYGVIGDRRMDKALLWIATAEELICFDKYTEKYNHFSHEAQGPASDELKVIHQDKRNRIWVGTENGLDRFEEKNGTFIHYSDKPGNNNKSRDLPGDFINDIYEDRAGALWICTDRGISRLDRPADRFIPYLNDAKQELRKAGYYLGTIYQDSKERYWVGGRGLFRFYPGENLIKPYFHKTGSSAFWIDEMVSVIYEDGQGNLWIGTSGDGLYRLTPKGGVLNLRESRGFSGDYIMAVLEDGQGFLWVSTYLGLAKVDPRTGDFKNYGRKDGLTYNYFNLRCAGKDQVGRMYFGQTVGYTEFDPAQIKDNPNESNVVITGISVFNKKIEPEIPVLGYSKLILLYDQNMLTFEYVLLNYTNSRHNKYKHLLEGVDKNWVFANGRRIVSYSGLQPGDYTFHVRGCNSDGIWNAKGPSVKITITPPWWRTWWAYALYVILAAAVLFGSFRFETKRREMQHRAVVAELQARTFQAQKEAEQEQMRGRIAGDLHDEIGSNLSSIVLLGETLERRLKPTGKEKQRLKQIRHIAMATAESMRDIVWFVNPLNDDMDKLMVKMRETANTMLGQFRLRFDIKREDGLAWEGDLNFRRNVFLFFKEALQNVLRHSQATEVAISIRQNKQLFRLEIQDNGVGFDTTASSPGNGLKNFERRSAEMEAFFTLTTKPGEGTSVLLTKNIP